MTDNMKKFMEAAASDEGLRGKLDALDAEHRAKCIALAGEHGIALTEADFTGGMDDDELAAVAGGRGFHRQPVCPGKSNYRRFA
jgi:predicted ribosomally synthesized peptide with nif11-like leader